MSENKREYKIASCGVGVDSVAGLIKYGVENFDEIIFADTGSEKAQTYEYLDYLIKEKKWPITVIASHYGKIYDYYYNKRRYPNRWNRDCSGKFKIDVMHKYLRQKYGKKAHFHTHIFIDYSEFHRVRESKYKYETCHYPLVDDKITRADAVNIILQAGYKLPIKSGCYFCPFTKPEGWIWLRNNNPEEYAKALEMEKHSSIRKKREFPLISYKGKGTSTLFECGCFNPK